MPGDSLAANNLIDFEDRKRGGRGGGGVPTELRELPLSDVWLGKLFAYQWRKTTRYDHEAKKFLIYGDGRWGFDKTGEVDRRIQRTIDSIKTGQGLPGVSDPLMLGKQRESLDKFYFSCLQDKQIEVVRRRARSEIPCTMDQFDVDPMLFNLANGTIDLRTGELRPANPAEMLAKQSPVIYDTEAACPEWCAAVDQWFAGDKSMVAYLRRITALFLTGDVKERAFFMLYGTGRNGKGTYVSTVEALLGPDYAFALPVERFLKTGNPQMEIDVHAARGKRLIVIGETESGANLNAAKIKHWTSGGDTMSGKALFQELTNYQPTHKLLLQTNHEPRFNDRSAGFADRLKKIPFLVQISDKAMKLGLKDHLRENELPGILNWALGPLPGEEGEVGLKDWLLNRLSTPKKVSEATTAMLESQDDLRLFIQEAGELGAGFECERGEGYIGYRNWCDQNRVRRPLGKNQFISAMREQPDIEEKVSGSRASEGGKAGWRGWRGFRLNGSTTSSRPICENCASPAVADGRCARHPRGAEQSLEGL